MTAALVVVICSLTLSLGAAVAVNVQKLSMNREEKGRIPFMQPLWLMGMAVIVVDAIGDFVFISMAPQSMLAPLGSLSLGWNVILAPFFHRDERVTTTTVIATAVIYVGTITSILHAASSTPSYNLERITELARNVYFIQYLVLTVALQCTMILHGKRKGFGMLHFTALAGSLGGETLIFAKTSSELVKNAILKGEIDDLRNPISMLAIIMTIVTALAQLQVLNTGLAQFEALIVVPVYQTFLNTFAITGGLIFFQEYRAMSKKDTTMYFIGLIITLFGVKMLVQQRRKSVLPSHVE
eukprot:CAMPEP_0201695192 /NCGR_PEP_ID=MMETSP0578-20130828/7228_1 /ASSEMBLY_ACC=CAM_ASM_000663 /TAXON_ID=267565 /ORGANISM="Skeletonema grethea, Strain CCMP 1804" /LENGTH=296 /DNA_ID=CAMNT_0048181003 /DNA_START=29 /DNA_END=919 /DNA_ORIENTATION=-